MKASNQRSLILAASLLAVVLIFALFLAGVQKAGFLNLTNNSPPAEVLAAAVSLVGGLIAAAVSAVGLILKHSADERSATLQEQAEERLKLEAGLQAATLFSTQAGQPAPPMQRAVALYALAGLRQHDLAVDLVFGLLESGDLEPALAAGILDRVFLSDDLSAKRDAISRLGSHVEKLVVPSGVALPPSLSADPMSHDPYVRESLPYLFGELLLSRPVAHWQRHFEQVGMLVAALCLLWQDETNEQTKKDAGVVLSYALVVVEPRAAWLLHPIRRIDVRDVRKKLAEPRGPGTSSIEALKERMEEWAGSPVRATPDTP